MYMPLQAAALALPLLHSHLPVDAAGLTPTPITISGVVCASPHDMAGLFEINTTHAITSADELLTLGRDAGYRCRLLKNAMVFNWGQVSGPDGTVHVAGGKTAAIVEVVESGDGEQNHYFLISKSR